MGQFKTTIYQMVERGALTLLARARDADADEPLEPVVEVERCVEVFYYDGWRLTGRRSGAPEDCCAEDGQSPEVYRIVALDEDAPVELDLTQINRQEFLDLEDRAWQHQLSEQAAYADYAADVAFDDYMECMKYDL